MMKRESESGRVHPYARTAANSNGSQDAPRINGDAKKPTKDVTTAQDCCRTQTKPAVTPQVASALSLPHVHIKDQQSVERKIENMTSDGTEALQVIADFDATLSAFTLKGQRCVTCHKALDDSPLLPEDYRNQANALRDHYYPLEIDPILTLAEKLPIMVKWWTQSHNLLLEYKCLNRSKLKGIVKDARIFLRDGCTQMIDSLHARTVPLLIFSAGLGDVIREVVEQQATMHPSMHIVANMMTFDDEGELTGFENDLIHSLNKNENSVHDSDYFVTLKDRHNVVLLGDNVGDLCMSKGTDAKNLLTIGFLNDKITERLDAYMDAFDIVLVSDETMKVPHTIIQEIIQ